MQLPRPIAVLLFALVLLLGLYLLQEGGASRNESVAPPPPTVSSGVARNESSPSDPEGERDALGVATGSREVDPVGAEAAKPRFRLVCRDLLHRVVPDVELLGERQDGCARLGRTDAGGALELEATDERELAVSTRHPDSETATWTVRVVPGGERELALAPGASISGRVAFPDGRLDFEGVLVLACPIAHLPSPSAVAAARAGAPTSLHLAAPDAAGAFRIAGLGPDARYFVTAGGPGCMVREPVKAAKAGAERLELLLWRLYGARVALGEAGGSPLRGSPQASRAYGFAFHLPDGEFEFVGNRSTQLALAGIAPAALRTSADHERVLLCLSSADLAREGPVALQLDLPGYAQAARSLWLPPASDTLEELRIELEPSAAGWSALEVRFTGGADLHSLTPRTQLPAGVLQLTEPDGRGLELGLLDLSSGEPSRFELPRALYAASFTAREGGYRFPDSPGTVELDLRGGDARLEIPLERSGAVHVELREPDGGLFEGAAILRIRPYVEGQGRNGAYRHARFERPPYVLQCLAPGRYSVAAITGSNSDPPGREAFTASVVEVSALRTAKLNLDRRGY